jgi:hypothetical protein
MLGEVIADISHTNYFALTSLGLVAFEMLLMKGKWGFSAGFWGKMVNYQMLM